MKRNVYAVPFALILASTLLVNSGCANNQTINDTEDNSQGIVAPEEAESVEETAVAPEEHNYELGSSVDYQGVVLPVDPTWSISYGKSRDKQREVDLTVKPVEEEYWNHIVVKTSLYGDCKSVQSAWDSFYSATRPVTVISEWEDSGVRFQTGLYEDDRSSHYFITGNETSTNKGFVIELQLSEEWSIDDREELFTALVNGFTYDPSNTTFDYHDAYTGKTDSKNHQSNSSLSEDDAIKALVVGCNNAWATDVFESDGNTYDISKLHGFGDKSGDYFVLIDNGKTERRSDTEIQVSDVEVEAYKSSEYTGTTYTLNGTVSLVDGKYLLSDVSMEFYTPSAASGYKSGEFPLQVGDESVVFNIDSALIGS